MNLENLNKWLTLAANIGVLAGIVFLGWEIQQNNTFVELEYQAGVSSDVNSFIDMVIQDPTLVEIQGKRISELTPVERDRLYLLGSRLLSNFESRFDEMKAGLTTEENLKAVQNSIYHRPVLNYGMPMAWDTFKLRANPEFRVWFEQNVIESQ